MTYRNTRKQDVQFIVEDYDLTPSARAQFERITRKDSRVPDKFSNERKALRAEMKGIKHALKHSERK